MDYHTIPRLKILSSGPYSAMQSVSPHRTTQHLATTDFITKSGSALPQAIIFRKIACHPGLKLATRPEYATFGSPDGAARCFSQILVAHPLQYNKNKRFPLIVRKPCQSIAEIFNCQPVLMIRLTGQKFTRHIINIGRRTLFTKIGDKPVPENTVHPGSKIRSRDKAVTRIQSVADRILDQILSLCTITGQRERLDTKLRQDGNDLGVKCVSHYFSPSSD